MSDDRDNPAGPPPEPPVPAAPPPLAAEPPPLAQAPPAAPTPPPAAAVPPPAPPTAPAAPAAYAPAPAKASPLPWIIAGGIGLVLAVLAILYFTGVFGGRGSWLVGTWGPGCPANRAEVVTFNSDGTMNSPGGQTGTWSLSGDNLTLRAEGRSGVVRWVRLSQNSARVTIPGSGRSIVQNRCN